jgi:hypothetical protein
MGHLSESQLATVRALLTSAPDYAVRDLEATLAQGSESHDVMRMIRAIVVAEALDRRARCAVFRPIVPLCSRPQGRLGGVTFPQAALAGIWRGLKIDRSRNVEMALAAADPRSFEAPSGEVYDELCAEAAAGLRARANDGYAAAAAALEQGTTGGAEAFAAYLDVAPVARLALDRMHDWLGRLNDERIASARLAFRDAVAVADDAGPRLLEILYAHLEEPWAVLRLVSAVMQRPDDRFVASSELAVFGERLLDDIDAQLKLVTAFDSDRGLVAGETAGAAVRTATLEIQEFDESMDLSPDGPWGSRLTRQRRSLVQAVEGRLKAVEAEVAGALPVQTAGFRRKGVRGHPRLTADPDPRQVQRGLAFLSFLKEVRVAGERLGFGALWAKTAEQVQNRLDTYVEDLLEKLRTGEGDDLDRVRTFLDIAAEFTGVFSDDRAAQIVRRRMAAAA